MLHHRACHLCEALCGIVIEAEGDRVSSVRGDEQDAFSQGYICPKAASLADIHHDPDRLRQPMIRDGAAWRTAGWVEEPAPAAPAHRVELNDAQRAALDAIDAAAGRFSVTLLQGVTGSGKTDVYAAAASRAIARGGQASIHRITTRWS